MFKRADGRWCEKIRIGGKIKYLYAPTKRELLQKLREHDYIAEHGVPFEIVAAEWREEHYKQLTPNSQKPYNGAYNRALQYLSAKDVKEITKKDILKIIADMQSQEYAKKTVATQILVLNLIFKYAILNDYANSNPCDLIEPPKNLKKTKREMPSNEDIQRIVDNVDTDPFGLFAYFLYYTGCRLGEALALQGKDIDLENGKIQISKSAYFQSGTKIKAPKTESGTRTIPLLDCLRDKLPKLKDNQYLFSHLEDRSEPYTQKRIETQWHKFRERLGITCTPHQLRHGYATLLYDAGLTPKDAQSILGHASIEMTADIYTHITNSRAQQNADKLNDFVNANVKK